MKTFISLIAIVTVAVPLSGCVGAEPGEEADESVAEIEPTAEAGEALEQQLPVASNDTTDIIELATAAQPGERGPGKAGGQERDRERENVVPEDVAAHKLYLLSGCQKQYVGSTQYWVTCPDGVPAPNTQFRARATCYLITNESTWVWRYGAWTYVGEGGWSIATCPTGYEAAPPGAVQFRNH